ncbi:MAG: Rv3235 family protein, partial [Actinomycetes bacterium]
VQGTLALAFVLPTGVPSTPQAPPDLRLVPAPRPDAEEDQDAADFGPQPTPRHDLPEPRRWSGRFVQAVVEVLAGDRPVTQLVRWTTTDVYDEVACRVLDGAAGRLDDRRAVVRSVHVSEPADGIAEVAAMVRRGLRTTAVAMRLEGLDGRWQCTAIELG